MKLGILSGTFDPVHAGHLTFAKAAIERFHLNKVLLMPERKPRRKTGVTKFDDRLAMLELAVQGDANIEVMATDEDNFTITATLPIIKGKYKYDALHIFLGSDAALHLNDWEDIEQLPKDVSFIVARRDDAEAAAGDNLSFIDSPKPEIASSQIRRGQSRSGIEAVDRYIAEHHLYR